MGIVQALAKAENRKCAFTWAPRVLQHIFRVLRTDVHIKSFVCRSFVKFYMVIESLPSVKCENCILSLKKIVKNILDLVAMEGENEQKHAES